MSPVITTAPPPVVKVTKTYDTVTLQCAARGSPVPNLEWNKDGVVISTNTTSKTADEVKGELVISRFSAADQGVYKCFFKNYDNGTAEISTTAGIKYDHSKWQEPRSLISLSSVFARVTVVLIKIFCFLAK